MGIQPFKNSPLKEKEIGICEECGEYTDTLIFMETMWICKSCTEGMVR